MPITYIIIGITVLVSFLAWSRRELLGKLIFNPYLVHTRGQYQRFLTSGFVHQDHAHLLFNMLTFYFFGLAVESRFTEIFGDNGTIYFVALYLMAIVVSEIPTYFKNKNDPRYNSLGASGGVAAIVFALILFEPLKNFYLYFAIPIPGVILGVGYIIYSIYQGRKMSDNVNHDAHLYGALFGLLFCIVLYPQALPDFLNQIIHWNLFK
jgi:membrane associated rhomboid family serine protease